MTGMRIYDPERVCPYCGSRDVWEENFDDEVCRTKCLDDLRRSWDYSCSNCREGFTLELRYKLIASAEIDEDGERSNEKGDWEDLEE